MNGDILLLSLIATVKNQVPREVLTQTLKPWPTIFYELPDLLFIAVTSIIIRVISPAVSCLLSVPVKTTLRPIIFLAANSRSLPEFEKKNNLSRLAAAQSVDAHSGRSGVQVILIGFGNSMTR